MIVGDLDSIEPTTLAHFRERGTTIHHLPSQDNHDLNKSIDCLAERVGCSALCDDVGLSFMFRSPTHCVWKPILVVGAIGGRFDHTLSALSTLHQYPSLPIVYLSNTNFITLISPSSTPVTISRFDLSLNWLSRHQMSPFRSPLWGSVACGLVPLCGPSTVTTTGLRWNLGEPDMNSRVPLNLTSATIDGQTLTMGSFISTSNLMDNTEVTVSASAPLIWTCAMPPFSPPVFRV